MHAEEKGQRQTAISSPQPCAWIELSDESLLRFRQSSSGRCVGSPLMRLEWVGAFRSSPKRALYIGVLTFLVFMRGSQYTYSHLSRLLPLLSKLIILYGPAGTPCFVCVFFSPSTSSSLSPSLPSLRVSVEDPTADPPICAYLVEADVHGPDVKRTYTQALKGEGGKAGREGGREG